MKLYPRFVFPVLAGCFRTALRAGGTDLRIRGSRRPRQTPESSLRKSQSPGLPDGQSSEHVSTIVSPQSPKKIPRKPRSERRDYCLQQHGPLQVWEKQRRKERAQAEQHLRALLAQQIVRWATQKPSLMLVAISPPISNSKTPTQSDESDRRSMVSFPSAQILHLLVGRSSQYS